MRKSTQALVALAMLAPAGLQAQAFPPVVDASALDGADGFALLGVQTNDFAGGVGSGGDLDGDGLNEILIAASRASRGYSDNGEAYVLYGRQEFPPVIHLENIYLGDGLVIEGLPDDFARSGESIAGVGDANGDGYEDFLVGVYLSDRPEQGGGGDQDDDGEAFLFYGRGDLQGRFSLDHFGGAHGVIFEGTEPEEEAGFSVAGLGDLNGDGLADFGVGALENGGVGKGLTYAIFGSTSFPDVVSLDSIDGSSGFTFEGAEFGDGAYGVAYAGDLNHDGLDDVIIGAALADSEGLSRAGETYVVYGALSYPSTRITPADLDGELGFTIAGIEAESFAGSAHGVSDFNGDGLDDLVIGAAGAMYEGLPSAGVAYVVFGRDGGFPSQVSLGELDGTNGLVLFHEEEFALLGTDTAEAGDINGDGLADLIIGAQGVGKGFVNTGAAYVVFGTRDPMPATLSVLSLDGTTGFAVIPLAFDATSAGVSVASAGDVNGDGLDDLLVGDDGLDGNGSNAGGGYVVFGRSLLEFEVSSTSCPGPVEIQLTGATPNAPVAVVAGSGLGTSSIPGNLCGGLELSLDGVRPLRQLVADQNGAVTLSSTLTAGACGRWLQAIDTTACRKSAARALPER